MYPVKNNQDKDVIKTITEKGYCRAVFVETAQQICLFPLPFRSLCVVSACCGKVKRITELLVEEASGGPHPASHLKPHQELRIAVALSSQILKTSNDRAPLPLW